MKRKKRRPAVLDYRGLRARLGLEFACIKPSKTCKRICIYVCHGTSIVSVTLRPKPAGPQSGAYVCACECAWARMYACARVCVHVRGSTAHV